MIRQYPTCDRDKTLIVSRRKPRGFVVKGTELVEHRVSTHYFASVNWTHETVWYPLSLDERVLGSKYPTKQAAINALVSHMEFQELALKGPRRSYDTYTDSE